MASETTPTRLVYENPDGSNTAIASSRPERFRDSAGEWREIDLTVDRVDGGFRPRAAERPVTLADRTGNGGATLTTRDGEIVLSHPDVRADVAGKATGPTVLYPNAMPGDADLEFRVIDAGVEESVIIPDANAPTSHQAKFVLPEGVAARESAHGIEFIGAKGDVIAEFADGVAFDAATPPNYSSVSVRLAEQRDRIVIVTVAAKPTWVHNRARVFPVTIDPTLLDTTTNDPDAVDTMIGSTTPTTAYSTAQMAYVGQLNGVWETLLKFDLQGEPASDVYVSEAHVSVNEQTPSTWNCDSPGTQVGLQGLDTYWPANVTWNTRPTTGFGAPTVRGFGGCMRGWLNIDATEVATAWMTQARPNHGVRLFTYNTMIPGFEAITSKEFNNGVDAPKLHVTYTRKPSVPVPTTPDDKSIVGTPTPTLVVDPSDDPDDDTVSYWFRVLTSPPANVFGSVAQIVANSGWTTSPSWQVPSGVLEGGRTYYWQVFTSDGHYFEHTGETGAPSPSTGSSWYRQFTVDSQLGADNRRPSDEVGPVRVNLVNGNATLAIASPAMATVGGGIGVSLAYNSAVADTGLEATYWKSNAQREEVSKIRVRRDPVVDFDWNAASPLEGVDADLFRVTWEGDVTVPVTGDYHFGAAADDGVRTYINGTKVLDRWVTQTAAEPQYGTAVHLNAFDTVPIKIEYFEDTGDAEFHPWVKVNGTPMPVPVPWFSPGNAPFGDVVPTAWTFSPGGGALAYVAAWTNLDGSVTLEGPDGFTTQFRWNGSAFVSPEGEHGTLTRTASGELVMTEPGGGIYHFDVDGFLRSATSPIDDDNPAAPTYRYDGIGPVLLEIIDPVSARSVKLRYQGAMAGQNCPAPPGGQGFDATPPDGMLCQITYFDNRTTNLFYRAHQLARVEQPGAAITDFGYVGNRIVEIRDALATDTVAAGFRADDVTTRTQIAYDGNRVSGVTLAAPAAGQARPAHTYAYGVNETVVHVAGLTEPNGFARKVAFDGRGRTLSDTDATARVETTSWDTKGRPSVVVDPAGQQVSMFYDAADRLTGQYGPAPSGWFDPQTHLPTSSHTNDVPHSKTGYDQDFVGLAAAWYSNRDLMGVPKAHTTAPTTSNWGSGSPAPAVPSDNFSGLLSGQVEMGAGGGTLTVGTSPQNIESSGARLFVDDEIALDTTPATIRDEVASNDPVAWWRLGESGGTYAMDAAGGNKGTYVGPVTTGAAGALANDPDTAILTGANRRVSVPHDAVFDLKRDLTIEAWVKPTVSGKYHIIASKAVGNGVTNNTFELRLSPTLFPQFVQVAAGTYYGGTASSAVLLNTWTHVAVTRTGSQVEFWKNGVSAGAFNGVSGDASVNPSPVLIGARADVGQPGYTYDFQGGLDEVAIFDKALQRRHFAARTSAYARAVVADAPDSWLRFGESTPTNGTLEYGLGAEGKYYADPPAIYQGGVTLAQAGLVGDGNTAAHFDGSSGWVRPQGYAPLLYRNWNDGFTIEAWVKPTAATADGRIVDFGLPGPTGSGGKDSIVLQRAGTTTNLAFKVNVGGVWQPTITASNALPLNQPSHLAVTVTREGAVTIYRNGAAVATGTTAIPASITRETPYIGRAHTGGYWAGTIDELALYKDALPAGRVAMHYAAATGGVVANATTSTIAAGPHRIRVEYAAAYGTAALAVSGTNLVDGVRPAYGLPTSAEDADGKRSETHYVDPMLGQVSQQITDPGLNQLTTAYTYEPVSGINNYGRQKSRTLPAGNAWTYEYYGGTESRDNPCTPAADSVNQGGLQKLRKAPAPSGTGSEVVDEVVYDAAARTVASRTATATALATAPWTCVTYDERDRPATRSVPANGAEPARTIVYNYAVGSPANPLVTAVGDYTGWITTGTDLLGRIVSHKDAFGNVTTTTYDQPGRATDSVGPIGALHSDFDAAGRPISQKLAGATIALPTYDAAGRLATVSYPTGAGNAGNGTSLTLDRDELGRTNSYVWKASGGILNLATDSVTFSRAGRVKDQAVDGLDANLVGDNYTYDDAGRLTNAWSLGHAYTYSFVTNPCGVAGAGLNTNRTSSTDNLTTTTYCYDAADRLTSTTSPGITAVAYDNRGNTTTLGGQTLTYDGADRHMVTTAAGVTVRYARDALDRIIARTENGVVTGYGFSAPGDSPSFVVNTSNQVIERQVGLLGGAMVTKRAAGDVWSYPNIHGDVVATANAAGTKTGSYSYDPYGSVTSTGSADNSAGNLDYGWHGQQMRPREHAAGIDMIEMGARPYVAALGRFLQVDPVEGGSSNDYDYVSGDPLNRMDLSGEFAFVIPVVVIVVAAGATIVAISEASRPEWQQHGLSRCPTRKECQTATKLLKSPIGKANKIGKKLDENRKKKLRDLVKRGTIKITDASWMNSEFPSLFGERDLKTIRTICKDAYGGSW